MSIERLIDQRRLERVEPAPAHADRLLTVARDHVTAAAQIVDADPTGAHQLSYDATRKAASAILAINGLRPTSRGGHAAVVDSIRDMGVEGFAHFDRMRRLRNRLQYPEPDGARVTSVDVFEAIAWAKASIEAAGRCIA